MMEIERMEMDVQVIAKVLNLDGYEKKMIMDILNVQNSNIMENMNIGNYQMFQKTKLM